MVGWELAFDYAATVMLLLIMVWYFTQKRISVNTHKTFFAFVMIIFSSTILEISTVYISRYMSDYTVFYSAVTLQNLCCNLVPLAFAKYLLTLANVDMVNNEWLKTIYKTAFSVDLFISLLNPFTKWIFTYDENGFIPLAGEYIMYALGIFVLLLSVVMAIKSTQKIMFVNSQLVMLNLVAGIIVCIAQLFMFVPALSFLVSCVAVALYFYMQNPGTVIDSVTGLFNRRFMGEYLQDRFELKKKIGIILVAMDDFKYINRAYGVENGDNLLFQVGSFLESLKIQKEVFRFGSDQFCVVITKNTSNIGAYAEEILERFRHPWYSKTSVSIMMSSSISCINCPVDADNYGDLIEVMDYSMAFAKKTKKGGITFASEAELDKIREDKAIEKAVKQAMDRDELMVYYQPIYSVGEGVYSSAEALVRLRDSELGWIPPDKFIPIAEKNGLIVEMGEMILDKVCRFIRDFKIEQTNVKFIEVNISPVQLLQINFSERVKDIMEKYDVKPHQINMEITETANMGTMPVVEKNINNLVDYGIKFSLDDYGSGYSNIDYINRMPFSIIKLDKYIIWDAFKNNKAGITLEYTIGMLNALNLLIVAEGVETEEMKDHLVDIGCHYMQGWFYSKAIADVDFMKLINT